LDDDDDVATPHCGEWQPLLLSHTAIIPGMDVRAELLAQQMWDYKLRGKHSFFV